MTYTISVQGAKAVHISCIDCRIGFGECVSERERREGDKCGAQPFEAGNNSVRVIEDSFCPANNPVQYTDYVT
jgi:hypothetical protein